MDGGGKNPPCDDEGKDGVEQEIAEKQIGQEGAGIIVQHPGNDICDERHTTRIRLVSQHLRALAARKHKHLLDNLGRDGDAVVSSL